MKNKIIIGGYLFLTISMISWAFVFGIILELLSVISLLAVALLTWLSIVICNEAYKIHDSQKLYNIWRKLCMVLPYISMAIGQIVTQFIE